MCQVRTVRPATSAGGDDGPRRCREAGRGARAGPAATPEGHEACSHACPQCSGECVRQFDHLGDHQCENGHNW